MFIGRKLLVLMRLDFSGATSSESSSFSVCSRCFHAVETVTNGNISVMSALRAPDSASPPQNMHRALIFSGVTVFTLAMSVFVFRGHQRRREMDARQAEMNRESRST